MQIETFTGGATATNGYLIHAADGSHVLFDAPAGVATWLEQRGIRVTHLVLTHQHFDHVLDAAAVIATGAEVLAWAPYSTDLTLEAAARSWGMPQDVRPFEIKRLLEGTDTLELGGHEFRLAHVPGHSPDSVTFHQQESATVICGDTVFAGSIGRTDLPGGSHQTLIDGIKRHLLTLPEPTRLLPGHGPGTTVGAEKSRNPFLV